VRPPILVLGPDERVQVEQTSATVADGADGNIMPMADRLPEWESGSERAPGRLTGSVPCSSGSPESAGMRGRPGGAARGTCVFNQSSRASSASDAWAAARFTRGQPVTSAAAGEARAG